MVISVLMDNDAVLQTFDYLEKLEKTPPPGVYEIIAIKYFSNIIILYGINMAINTVVSLPLAINMAYKYQPFTLFIPK